jgi:hypothetical protein
MQVPPGSSCTSTILTGAGSCVCVVVVVVVVVGGGGVNFIANHSYSYAVKVWVVKDTFRVLGEGEVKCIIALLFHTIILLAQGLGEARDMSPPFIIMIFIIMWVHGVL